MTQESRNHDFSCSSRHGHTDVEAAAFTLVHTFRKAQRSCAVHQRVASQVGLQPGMRIWLCFLGR